MEEHPGVIFRNGPAGRRACLVGGPDVWEVIRAVKSARATEPELSRSEIVRLVEDNTGVPGRLVALSLEYWAAYPHEVEALITHAEQFEEDLLRAAEKTAALLDR